MALGIGEVTDHEACGGLCWAHPARPAQALGSLERGLDIGNADVEDRVAGLRNRDFGLLIYQMR